MKYYFYSGSYGKKGEDGISFFELDIDKGTLEKKYAFTGITNPSYLGFNSDRTIMYAVQEEVPEGQIHALKLNGIELEVKKSESTKGADPCHVSLDSSNKIMFVDNYTSGSLAVYKMDEAGYPIKMTEFIQHEGHGINPVRQEAAHCHYTKEHEGNAFVVDLGLDKVFIYRVDTEAGTLDDTGKALFFEPGDGPRHLEFNRNMPGVIYAACELANKVIVFKEENGNFIEKQCISTLPEGYLGESTVAAIKVHKDLLFVSNRGDDSIAIFRVGEDGLLTLSDIVKTGGKTPRDFTQFDDYLVVANQDSDSITVLKTDWEKGTLTDTGISAETVKPSCIRKYEFPKKKKVFAQVGSFAMKPGSLKGIHMFEYESERGLFKHVGDFRPEINAGQSAYNQAKAVGYITHESHDEGAGKLLSFRIDRATGKPEWLNEVSTCANLPAYVCVAKSGNYVLAPHHGTGNLVAKTIQNEDGTFELRYECDDTTLVLVKLQENGSLGEIADIFRIEMEETEKGRKIPHLHCCVPSVDGEFFIVCDKGLDRVYTFKIDEEKEKLQCVSTASCEEGTHPRYVKFHPNKPFIYQNNEASAFINVWKYDENGVLTRVQRIGLLETEEKSSAWTAEGASDLVVTSDGKYLYEAVRGLNLLSVFSIGDDGRLTFLQTIDCGGKNPRGIALSPDEKYVFSLNRDTDNIARFVRTKEGILENAGNETHCILPGNMQFM